MVRNVHVREIDASAQRVGAVLDTLGGPVDGLWPVPWWSPAQLDMPLRAGSGGGHGAIRYHVGRYEPGRLVEVVFDPGQGLDGTCTFAVEPVGPARCRVRVEADGELTGLMRLVWPVALRWLHDALVEDLLDRVRRAVETAPRPDTPNRWSTWVRLLRRWDARPRAVATDVPSDGLLPDALARIDAADAYAVDLGQGLPEDPQSWADALFGDLPPVVTALMAVREALVGLVGIERGRGDEFDTRTRTDGEVLLGADAGHLDFRCVVRREPARLVVATAVGLNGARGRLYWSVVRHVHPWVIRAMLVRSVRRARDRAPLAPSGRPVPSPSG